MINNVYLLLGSNEGDREANIKRALYLIGSQAGSVLASSPIYETAAWGKTDQAAFLNQAVCISYEQAALLLLQTLKTIEKEVGRISTEKWGPRIIDIDILLFNADIIQRLICSCRILTCPSGGLRCCPYRLSPARWCILF